MQKLQRIGYKSDLLLKRSFFMRKVLTYNSFTMPYCKRISIVFPIYEVNSTLKSKSIMIMMNFLEQLSGVKAIVCKANLILGSGLWVKGQVDLSGFNLMKFFLFFNEFVLSHPLLRFSTRLPILREVQVNFIKLIIFDIDFLFDTYTRRLLPHTNSFWLEFNFFFNNKHKLLNSKIAVKFYTQFFFSHNFLEWRNQ